MYLVIEEGYEDEGWFSYCIEKDGYSSGICKHKKRAYDYNEPEYNPKELIKLSKNTSRPLVEYVEKKKEKVKDDK